MKSLALAMAAETFPITGVIFCFDSFEDMLAEYCFRDIRKTIPDAFT
jgi:hypothetical protein